MSHLYPFWKHINLHVDGRISPQDAERQRRTAEEILARLRHQPGVVLADEVGMGKTFVALAVAISVRMAHRRHQPVVVMVPPSLQDKWPRDFSLFRSRCVPEEFRASLSDGKATSAEEFLKFLDDPLERRRSVIFVTHGAMSRGLSDEWVKLAVIRQALRGRHNTSELKRALVKSLGALLRITKYDKGPEFWSALLTEHPKDWRSVLTDWEVGDEALRLDDPVPIAVIDALERIDTDQLYAVLKDVPRRQSDYFADRIRDARHAIQEALRPAWDECLRRARLRLPLLILDEAHHLKNDDTRLASLFRTQSASDDIEAVEKGSLAGVFERMLFLTATPFQLGHHELCSVLERFKGIAWTQPHHGKTWFADQMTLVRKALDVAQEAALRLDDAWGRLRQEHLTIEGQAFSDIEQWWQKVRGCTDNAPEVDRVCRCYEAAYEKMREAEHLLRRWVIRHLKPRRLSEPHQLIRRRVRFPGAAIVDGEERDVVPGLDVKQDALVPFLLAARATMAASETRALFAEGLASSYEAFLHTRHEEQIRTSPRAVDTDDDGLTQDGRESDEMEWYLQQLDALVPQNMAGGTMSHPKIAATTRRVVQCWRMGEKVLVFCHFIATGKALRRAISHGIREEIADLGSQKAGWRKDDVFDELVRVGKRFFDEESPVRRACDTEVRSILQSYPLLGSHADDLVDAVRRIVRTPSFLVRFFPLHTGRLSEDDMLAGLEAPDLSGMSLRNLLKGFFDFLESQCDEMSRQAYIEAACRLQTGSLVERGIRQVYADEELQGEDARLILPNVRLVNGATPQETRQRLMLAFNTPFYPEILVASSVMAEGVDLHLNCRHIIHHDLCWNPSTLEQRTGRVDRVGAKAERCGKSIFVYLPYLSQTQDEKMFRVVTDRERWFSVVMGEKFEVNERATELLAQRVPLPNSVALNLALRLEVVPT